MTTYDNACLFLDDRIRFTGWRGQYHRGHAQCVRKAKRAEAEERNARQPGWGLTDGPAGDQCSHPGKKVYDTRDSVMAAFNGMAKWRRKQGLNPYQCPAGHWHLGRNMYRTVAVWRK
jgi:hypothetical protein